MPSRRIRPVQEAKRLGRIARGKQLTKGAMEKMNRALGTRTPVATLGRRRTGHAEIKPGSIIDGTPDKTMKYLVRRKRRDGRLRTTRSFSPEGRITGRINYDRKGRLTVTDYDKKGRKKKNTD